jgi:Secretion system C-terminal sorting domain/Fibronectin type III domain
LANLPSNNNTYTDNAVTADTDYWYYVRARYGNGYGPSIPIKIHTPALPVPVITATAVSPIKVDVNWANTPNNQSYEVVRSTDGVLYNIVIPNTGSNVNFFVDNTVLPNTKYWYAVRAGYSNGWSKPSNVVTVTTPPLPIPGNVVATSSNCTQINLNWTDTSGPLISEENFQISRSENGGPYALIFTSPANSTSYSDTKLKPNTSYSYVIRGRYAVGYSDNSAVATAVTKPLELTLVNSAATVANIKWGLCSNAIESWRVYLSKNGEPVTEAAILASNIDNYAFKNLLPNTKYSVYITDITSAGYGGASNIVNFTTTVFPGPTALTAVPTGTTNIKLNWKDNSNGPEFEESFAIYKSVEIGKFIELKGAANVTEYIDTDLKPNQKVCYYVAARYSAGYSTPSNSVCATTCPNSIAEFSKLEAISPTQIDVKWVSPEGSANSIIVLESSLDGVAFTKLADLDGTVTSYSDKTVLPNQKKYYRAYVTNEGTCKSTFSAISSTTSCALAPTGVKASAVSSSKIEVNWDLGMDIKTYIIERSTDNIDFVKAGEVDGKLSKFTDSGLTPSKKYYYRVSAKNEGTCTSATSDVKKESTATTCPAPPTNVVAVANSAKEIKLTFTDNSPDETGFEVEWSKDEKAWAKVGGTLAANTTALTISTGVDPETKYFFRVRATGEVCNSDYSTTASVTTNPAAPTGLTAKGVKINQNDLAWTNNTKTGTTIEVQRASGADNNFTKLGDLAINLNTYQSTGLTPATSYKYRIRYASPNGFSDWSNIAEATTLVISASEDGSLGSQVALYPVPTQNYLYLKPAVSILGKVNTKIVNIAGAAVQSQVFNGLIEGKTEQINVSNIGSGIYFLEVSTQKGSFTKKFIKQ